MDPTGPELAALTTIHAVCEWVGMDGALEAAFCEHLGLRPAGPPRLLAAVAEEDAMGAKTELRVGGEALKPGLRAMVGESWRIARVATKRIKSQEEVAKEQENQQK